METMLVSDICVQKCTGFAMGTYLNILFKNSIDGFRNREYVWMVLTWTNFHEMPENRPKLVNIRFFKLPPVANSRLITS